MLFVAGDERPRRDRFKVSGLYSTGMEELERTALTDLRNVQRLSGWSSGEVSGYDLFLGDVRQADRLAEAVNDALLRSDLPETDGVVAVSVGERYPAVFDWLKAHDVNAAVVIAVMVAVAFFNMASALLILVLERTRMIGLLKAMGMENRRIRRIFLYRAAFIVGRGLLWGNLAAGLLCWLQARFHLLRLDPAGYMPYSEMDPFGETQCGGLPALGGSRGGERGMVAGSRRRGGGSDSRAVARPRCVRGPYPPRRSDQNRLIMKPYDTELSKKEEVRAMFDNIAPAYDRLNHTLSLSVDRIWRRRVVRIVGRLHPRRVLDMATGTGDLAVMMARSIPEAHIKGVDLSEGMLDVARRKVAARGLEERVTLEAGDAETAVAAAGSVDVVTVAFGVRNFGDLGRGLAELSRALRPGGRIVILEFSTPTMPVFGRLYDWYSHRVLPRIGGWLSHDRQAYDYLPRSVDEFPQPEEFLTILAAAGFRDCRARSQSFGIAQIYTAEKC
jgi:demethylmenaquinone methyltransferase/2-methoxy-6-polyprenyl-1,4-benzoquinol methylase